VTGNVRLRRVDEQTLHLMLSIAVAETEPDEVMPPVAAPAGGWCAARREAFREFYRSSFDGLDGPIRTLMYAVICHGAVVGMTRMARRDEPDTVETGMWLGRSYRGRGIGRAALQLLLGEAVEAGTGRVVAETTSKNTAAVAVLRHCGAVLRDDGTRVCAEISLGPDNHVGVSRPNLARAYR
jgi:RimJ/RimL family protein N-acetyltransferase